MAKANPIEPVLRMVTWQRSEPTPPQKISLLLQYASCEEQVPIDSWFEFRSGHFSSILMN
jgi:hypothetical protein